MQGPRGGGSHQSGAEGQNPLLQPAGHAARDAAQGTVGFPAGHVQLLIPQYPPGHSRQG